MKQFSSAKPSSPFVSGRFVNQIESLSNSSRSAQRLIILLALLLGGLLVWAATATYEEQIVATGVIDANLSGAESHLLPKQLSALTEGPVASVFVAEGEPFKKEQILVQQEQKHVELQINQLESRVKQLMQRIDSNHVQQQQLKVQFEKRLQTSLALEAEAVAAIERLRMERKNNLDSATAELEHAAGYRLRIEELVQKNAESDSKLAEAKSKEKVARANLAQVNLPVGAERVATIRKQREEIEASYAVESGQLLDKLHTLRGELKNAEIEICDWRETLQQTTIRAPYDGIVTRIDVTPGEWLEPGKIPMEIAPDRSLIFKALVDSRDIKKIQPGLSTMLYPRTMDALRDEPIAGRVIRVAKTSSLNSDPGGIARQSYQVDVALDQSDLTVAWEKQLVRLGLNGRCAIKTGCKRSRLCWLISSLSRQFDEHQ